MSTQQNANKSHNCSFGLCQYARILRSALAAVTDPLCASQPDVTPHQVEFPVPAAVACSAEYYQCGGLNYDGPTCCTLSPRWSRRAPNLIRTQAHPDLPASSRMNTVRDPRIIKRSYADFGRSRLPMCRRACDICDQDQDQDFVDSDVDCSLFRRLRTVWWLIIYRLYLL